MTRRIALVLILILTAQSIRVVVGTRRVVEKQRLSRMVPR